MSDHPTQDHFSKAEIGKDAAQSTVEAAAETVGQVAKIITKAVQDVAGAVGGFATEIYEIRDAAKKASDEHAGGSAESDLPEPSDPAPSPAEVDPSESS
jgi:phage-related protein